MKKKYIIELEDNVTLWGFLTDTNGEIAVTGVIKQPYAEPDIERVRKEAYEEGYADAKCGYENGFENGMIVAWDEAKVGQEFQMGERKCVVTHNNDGTQCRVLWDNGVSDLVDNTDLFVNLTPTGRHFPEIAAVLEKMRGEQDG